MVEVGGFVEDFGGVGEDEEAVGEAGGDPEELERVGAEVESGPSPEVGGLGAQVDGDVPDVPGEHADELSLGPFELVVESAEDALGGAGLVILDKRGREIKPGKRILVVNFGEPAATISVAPGLDKFNVFQWSVEKGHIRQFARVFPYFSDSGSRCGSRYPESIYLRTLMLAETTTRVNWTNAILSHGFPFVPAFECK